MLRHHRLELLLAGALVLLVPYALRGSTITDNAADNAVDADNTPDTGATATSIRVGDSSTFGDGRAGIFPFQLPNLGNVPSPFTQASFSVVAVGKAQLPANVVINLDGLPAMTSPTIAAAGTFYTTSASTAGANMQPAFMPNAGSGNTSTTVTYSTSTTGSAGLLAYLNEQYAANASAIAAGTPEYVFLRAEPSAVDANADGYTVDTEESGASTAPTITYSVAPEPGSLALLALTVPGLLSARPRRRRR